VKVDFAVGTPNLGMMGLEKRLHHIAYLKDKRMVNVVVLININLTPILVLMIVHLF
jgi:hypothetical protein